MDIPTGIIGLAGLLALPCWLAVEWRGSHRLVRIGLGALCILAISTAVAGSHRGPLYVHKQLLTAIDRALEKEKLSRVRHALSTYDKEFQSTRDFMTAALAASEELAEAGSPSGRDAIRNAVPERILPATRDASDEL
jgi:hypothetical protein